MTDLTYNIFSACFDAHETRNIMMIVIMQVPVNTMIPNIHVPNYYFTHMRLKNKLYTLILICNCDNQCNNKLLE